MLASLFPFMRRFTVAAAVLALCAACAQADATDLVTALRERAIRLEDPPDLTPLIERIAPARLVLLGEASHGTSEFYTLRAKISRELILNHGFRFIAVEGDWNSLYRLNRYVKGTGPADTSAREIMAGFTRWPVWMWANEETAELIEWLRQHNEALPPEERVGFYGIDVYGKDDALRALPLALESIHPEKGEWLRGEYALFDPYLDDLHDYVRALQRGAPSGADAARAAVERLRDGRDELEIDDAEFLHLKQMAWVVKNAEKHYRAMAMRSPDSWNFRVDHFYQTVERLMDFYGPEARGVVWAHNTHIGDARATDMAQRGQRNIGQLARQNRDAAEVAAVGFGTHRGTVLAGRSWGGRMERMTTPPAAPGTLEAAMHEASEGNLLFLLDDAPPALRQRIGHRAIGVIYHPEREVPGNYVATVLPQRYDAFLFIEETKALTPVRRQE